VGDDVSVDSESLLVIDFVNLKIKPTQFFRGKHRGRVCVYIKRSEYLYVEYFFCAVLKKWSGRSVELTRPRETVEMARHGR
jgi:hypothetical protein